jgi:hypothetical protein
MICDAISAHWFDYGNRLLYLYFTITGTGTEYYQYRLQNQADAASSRQYTAENKAQPPQANAKIRFSIIMLYANTIYNLLLTT